MNERFDNETLREKLNHAINKVEARNDFLNYEKMHT
jgi:hypothetical protein